MNKLNKILTILRTLRYLKFIQIFYQLKYKLFKTKKLNIASCLFTTSNLSFFKIDESFDFVKFYSETEIEFNFLNLKKVFKNYVNWNFNDYGKLWNYNLQYLDYLKQDSISIEKKLLLIHDIYSHLASGKLIPEPYPSSLRIMNIIRFCTLNEIENDEKNKLITYLKAEFVYLEKNIEFHILANHLLENIFALLMLSFYFNDKSKQEKYIALMIKELNEQILNDGAHFEVTPMYHKIILFRLFELFAYIPENEFRTFVKEKLKKMMSWIDNMTFNNGFSPNFNDSTEGIAFSTSFFKNLSSTFNLNYDKLPLKDSAYRRIDFNDSEFIIDIGGIQPSYQPGHSHADTFSFCLNYKNFPIIVDPAISTYNIGERRNWERSTQAHNTISIINENSAEVWSGFRVGRRLTTDVLIDSNNQIKAKHDGFKRFGVIHQRTVKIENNNYVIYDELLGNKHKVTLNLYFHPDILLKKEKKSIFINDLIEIETEFDNFEILDYNYCCGYNLFKTAKQMKITTENSNFSTIIKLL